MIHEFIGFSNQTYNRANRCGDCPNNCPETGNCEQCLENVHYGIDGRTYNCTNILSYYVGKYTYKYSSEIGHVFNYPRFGVFQEYNILSLGCGPCTDYFGILNSITSNNRNIRLNYLGIDINNDWNPIHNWMRQRLGNTYGVLTMDVFDFLANPAHYLERKLPATKLEVLIKMLRKSIKEYKDTNKIAAEKFEELLNKTLEEYHKRRESLSASEASETQTEAVNSIIRNATQQALAILSKLGEDKDSFRKLGLTFEEKAFYDILMHLRDKYNFEYGEDKKVGSLIINDKSKLLAQKIKELIDLQSSFTDWLNNNNVRADLNQKIFFCLYENGYPPIYNDEVFDQVMDQVENFKQKN